jgi:hypothetical protein
LLLHRGEPLPAAKVDLLAVADQDRLDEPRARFEVVVQAAELAPASVRIRRSETPLTPKSASKCSAASSSAVLTSLSGSVVIGNSAESAGQAGF